LILVVILFLAGFSGIFVLMVFAAGYLYSVLYRWAVGIIVDEKGMAPYYTLAPVMGIALIFFYLLVRVFYRRFSWEGESYTVNNV
jgi:hypothetical protein